MADDTLKYTGEQIEEMLDAYASGVIGNGYIVETKMVSVFENKEEENDMALIVEDVFKSKYTAEQIEECLDYVWGLLHPVEPEEPDKPKTMVLQVTNNVDEIISYTYENESGNMSGSLDGIGSIQLEVSLGSTVEFRTAGNNTIGEDFVMYTDGIEMQYDMVDVREIFNFTMPAAATEAYYGITFGE